MPRIESESKTIILNDYGKERSWTIESRSRFRDDPTSTVPVNGKYVKPTGYTAKWGNQDFGIVEYNNRVGTSQQPIEAPPQTKYNPLGGHLALFENLQNAAIANSGEQRLQLGEYFGELPQSAQMIAKRAHQMYDLTKALKRGNVKTAALILGLGPWRKPGNRWKNTGQDASNIFLEMKYGWMPLLSDVHDSMEIIHGEVKVPSETGIITGGSTEKHSFVYPWTSTSGRKGLQNERYVCNATRRSRLKYSFEHPSRLRELNQLGLLNPLDVAWNLTGMSFVADWFLPVGDYLKGFTATTGTKFLDGYNSIYSEAVYTADPAPGEMSDKYGKAIKVPIRSDGLFVRTGILPSQARPQLPQFRAPKSIDQAISAVALVTQRLR